MITQDTSKQGSTTIYKVTFTNHDVASVLFDSMALMDGIHLSPDEQRQYECRESERIDYIASSIMSRMYADFDVDVDDFDEDYSNWLDPSLPC